MCVWHARVRVRVLCVCCVFEWLSLCFQKTKFCALWLCVRACCRVYYSVCILHSTRWLSCACVFTGCVSNAFVFRFTDRVTGQMLADKKHHTDQIYDIKIIYGKPWTTSKVIDHVVCARERVCVSECVCVYVCASESVCECV